MLFLQHCRDFAKGASLNFERSPKTSIPSILNNCTYSSPTFISSQLGFFKKDSHPSKQMSWSNIRSRKSLFASTILLFAFVLSQTFSPFGYLEGGDLLLNSVEVRESDMYQFSFETKLSFRIFF